MKIPFGATLGRTRCAAARGSALMLMIWAILIMSVTVMGVVEYITYSAEESKQAAYEFRALHLAESGIAVGLHPSTRRGDIVMKQKVGPDSGFDVVINYEGARIPINYITDERLRESVYNLFIYWQLNAQDAGVAADSLADWVDNDSTQRANGAEAEYYKSLGIFDAPRNQGFIRVDEMILVRGMDAVDRKKPDWRNYFSIYGEGQIDLRTVFKDVLLAISGASVTSGRPSALARVFCSWMAWRTDGIPPLINCSATGICSGRRSASAALRKTVEVAGRRSPLSPRSRLAPSRPPGRAGPALRAPSRDGPPSRPRPSPPPLPGPRLSPLPPPLRGPRLSPLPPPLRGPRSPSGRGPRLEGRRAPSRSSSP